MNKQRLLSVTYSMLVYIYAKKKVGKYETKVFVIVLGVKIARILSILPTCDLSNLF